MDQVIVELLKLGTPGVFILVLLYLLREEKKDNAVLRTENKSLVDKLFLFYQSSVEANVTSANSISESTRTTHSVASGLQNVIASISEILNIVRRLK